jgi:GxxExxY protein
MALLHEALSERVIGAAIEVHRQLGPGLLESAYEACLEHELASNGVKVARQVPITLKYKGIAIDEGYRIDLVVEDSVLIEMKSVKTIEPVHEAQLMTYLRLSGIRVGLLMNFNTTVLKNSILRRVL